MSECKKRGPYHPVGDLDWECLTHNVVLQRVDWSLPGEPRREDMACPIGEPERKPERKPS